MLLTLTTRRMVRSANPKPSPIGFTAQFNFAGSIMSSFAQLIYIDKLLYRIRAEFV